MIRKSTSKKLVAFVAEKQFLGFILGDTEYAIDILTVQEIRDYSSLTFQTIEKSPPFFRGFTNLHEQLVPVIDLRIFYNEKDDTKFNSSVIIIVRIQNHNVGVFVSGVTNIFNLKAEQIKSSHLYNSLANQDSLMGIGIIDDKIVPIIDIEKLFIANHIIISDFSPMNGDNHAK